MYINLRFPFKTNPRNAYLIFTKYSSHVFNVVGHAVQALVLASRCGLACSTQIFFLFFDLLQIYY